jgi:hypothetical protein
MQDVITIGKRLVPVEQIVFVEPFDPASNRDFKPEKPFKARVVLIDRDTVLAEFSPQEFAEGHGFRLLVEDNIAVNPVLLFRVETFAPTANFRPDKAYATRLKWRGPDGNEHSKLLLTQPDNVIAVVVRGEAESGPVRTGAQRPPGSRTRRRPPRKPELVRT